MAGTIFSAPLRAAPSPPSGSRADAESLERQQQSWGDAVRASRAGDWLPLRAQLTEIGGRYTDAGLTVAASSQVFQALTGQLLPLVVDEYRSRPEQLVIGIQLMTEFIDYARSVTLEAYVARKEMDLYARENDLATTLDSIGDAVIVTDTEGRVTRMNPVAERLTGFAIAQASGRALSEVFQIEHETTGAIVDSPVPRVLREGIVVGLANHTALVARDGVRRPIADSGAPIRGKDGKIRGVVLVFRDVTEERRAEEALRYWERIFQHATWGVALADVKDVRFKAVNPAYAAMHGYTVAELVGAPVSTLWAAGTRADMERHAHETHEHGQLIAETTHVRKDGTTLPVEVVATTIKDASGQVAWFVANVQDISERRRLQQSKVRAIELEAENHRIAEANRLKSEFLANMSHELRTPLNSIIGFTELLHDGQVGDVSAKQRDFLGEILAGGRHLLRLINDVLDLAKVEAGKMDFRPEPVDPGRLVATVVQSLRAAALEKSIEVAAQIDPSLPEVVLDPGRFKQILYNYVSNALKFSPAGGHVTVRVRAEAEEWLQLEVEDEGPGISTDQVPRLFVAFQQLDSKAARRAGGTGLGLALTRRLAEAQGGSVGVRPADGGGSVFFAILPQRHAGHAPLLAQLRGGTGLPKLLVVATESTEREAWSNSLMLAGYEVESVGGVAQAARVLKQGTLDGVVLDLDGDDPGPLKSVSGDLHGHVVPLVGVTRGEHHREADFAGIVDKPVEAGELLSVLARAGVSPPVGRPVLVVDDDASSLHLMQATLANLGEQAVCCSDAHEALRVLQRIRPIAVVIDIIMPNMDGLAFLERFREVEQHKNIPVMLWTVKDLTLDERARLQSRVEVLVQKGIGDGSRLSAALKKFLPPRVTSEGGP